MPPSYLPFRDSSPQLRAVARLDPMMSDSDSPSLCGAPTRQGGRCRNLTPPGTLCHRHRLPQEPCPLDPDAEAQRLLFLQEAAEDRAMRAHQASEGEPGDKLDAVFIRNATLVSNLARTRLALRKAGHKTGEADPDDDPVEIRLPDNGR